MNDKPNGPEDLGYTPHAKTRPPVTFAIPPSTPRKSCFSRHADVFWIVTPAGRKMPVDPSGTSHFATCPNAASHRRPR